MWRWLRVKLPKRFGVLGTLWLISGAMHAIIVIGAFLFGTISDSRQTLVVSGARRQTDARIVLLPMLKTVKDTHYDRPVRGTKFGVAATQKPLAQASKGVAKKQVVQQPKKHKTAEKKKNKTTLAALEKDKKIEPKKNRVEKPKPKESVKKIEPVKQPEKDQAVVAKNTPTAHHQEPEEKVENLLGDPNATEDIIYVGRDDLREMQTQHVVADALQKHWQAPSGIAQDTLCHISFDVDKEGRACNIIMKQNSKVLIFDVAARTAVVHAHFSPAAQGKQFTVAFKP